MKKWLYFVGGLIAALSATIYAAGWNGSGTFSRAHDWTDDRDAGIKILASRMDEEDDNFATGINACVTQNNENKPTADFAPNADATYDLGTAALRWVDVMLSNAVKFVDATGDVGSIVITTLSADRTYTLPDESGTLLTSNSAFTSLNLTADSNQLVLDSDGNATTLTTAATGAVTLTFPNVTSTIATLGLAQEYTKTQNFNETALTSTSNSVAWAADSNQVAYHLLTENTTIAAPSNQVDGAFYSLMFQQDASSAYTVAYNAVFLFPGGTAPTMSTGNNAIDIVTFRSDGTNMYMVGLVQDVQ